MHSIRQASTSPFRASRAQGLRPAAPRLRPEASPDWGFLRVLVAEDCATGRLLAQAQLSNWRIEPQFARDGLEAVRLACASHYDIILMDVEMPVLDGFAATAQIRHLELEEERMPRVPVVSYSSSEFDSLDLLARRSGMDAALKKPCTLKELGECLRRWCDKLSVGACVR